MRAWRLAGAALIVAAVIAMYHLALAVNPTTVAVTLLLAMLGISAFWGLAEALVGSVVGVLGFNYFFLPPVHTFTMEDPQNWVALGAFLVTAVTASQLGERARRRAAEADARRREMRAALRAGAGHDAWRLRRPIPSASSCSRRRRCWAARARRSITADRRVGALRAGDQARLPTPNWPLPPPRRTCGWMKARFLALAPVRLGGRSLGSLALVGTAASAHILRAIAHLAAITIEKARALEEASHAEAARQSEALKAALLDSLAHDIKTPLTSIKAAVTSLLGSAEPAQHELLTIIDEEADRLNRLAAEVIAMARIEAGKLHLEKAAGRCGGADCGGAGGVRGAAAGAAGDGGRRRRAAAGVTRIREFMVQVVKQFIENALKYSPAGSPAGVCAQAKGEKIVIGVGDRGPGIEENERLRIFEKFYRGRRHRFE